MAEAAHQVVVDQSRRLQVGVADRGTDETEAARPQVGAERVGEGGGGGDLLHAAPPVHLRAPVDELPQIGVERFELVLDGGEGAGVAHRRLHLGPVADDARVTQDPLDPLRRESGHLLHVEVGEEAPVPLPLLEDGEPAQSRLRPFENEEFEVGTVVVHRHPPFGVVVRDVPRALRPLAADPVVGDEPIGVNEGSGGRRHALDLTLGNAAAVRPSAERGEDLGIARLQLGMTQKKVGRTGGFRVTALTLCGGRRNLSAVRRRKPAEPLRIAARREVGMPEGKPQGGPEGGREKVARPDRGSALSSVGSSRPKRVEVFGNRWSVLRNGDFPGATEPGPGWDCPTRSRSGAGGPSQT